MKWIEEHPVFLRFNMRKSWIIYCPYCNKNTTIGLKPGASASKDSVKCSLCNRLIEAKTGAYRYTPIVYRKEDVDLLII